MPADNFIVQASRTGLSLSPVLNTLNGMIMLCHRNSCHGSLKTLKLPEEDQDELELVFSGLYHAVIPQVQLSDFDDYIKYILSCDPTDLKKNILDSYYSKYKRHGDDPEKPSRAEFEKQVLKSREQFLQILGEAYSSSQFNPEIEGKAYDLITNPPEMQKHIASLVTRLWKNHFKDLWKDAGKDLSDFIDRTDVSYLKRLSREESIFHMTGIEIPAEHLEYILQSDAPLIFVPSFDIINSYTKMHSAGVLYVFFDPVQYENRRLHAQLDNIDELAKKMTALADENRMKILKYIINRQEACSQDILKDLGFSQSAVSRQLKHLSDSGILEERRQMSAKYYRVKAEYIRNILTSLTKFLTI